jgi:hypothetical protein
MAQSLLRRYVRMNLAYRYGGGFVLIALFAASMLGAFVLALLASISRLFGL